MKALNEFLNEKKKSVDLKAVASYYGMSWFQFSSLSNDKIKEYKEKYIKHQEMNEGYYDVDSKKSYSKEIDGQNVWFNVNPKGKVITFYVGDEKPESDSLMFRSDHAHKKMKIGTKSATSLYSQILKELD